MSLLRQPNVPLDLDEDLRVILDANTDFTRSRLELEQERRMRSARVAAGGENLSLAQMILASADNVLYGPPREFAETLATLSGVQGEFHSQRLFLPWAMLEPRLLARLYGERDLTVASAASAGYLVATSVGAAQDVLR